MPDFSVVEQASARCPVCGRSSDDCGCPLCEGCSEIVSEVCSRCAECPDCCDCRVCSANDAHRVDADDLCSHCLECLVCCDCRRPDCGCDPDADDEYVCSNCDNCEERHCSCSVCECCGERSSSVCEHCNNCSDHCACPTCAECGEHVRSVCNDCDRCYDCGCDSGCDEEELDGEELNDLPVVEAPPVTTTEPPTTAVTDAVLASVTFDPPLRDRRVTPCDICGSRACSCHFCWEQVDGRWRAAHKFYNPYRERSCDTCKTCKKHCRADKICQSCSDADYSMKHHSLCDICGQCGGHCRCPFCSGCDRRVAISEVCSVCLRCTPHCRCPICSDCGSKRGHCGYCKKCIVCCQLPESPCGASNRGGPIPYINQDVIVWQRPESRPPTMTVASSSPTGLRHFTRLNPGFKRNPSSRELGVEIETNGCTKLGRSRKLWNAIEKWKVAVKADGSIGDLPQAFELNLMPSCGDVFLTELEEICDGLKEIGANPSHRCGIHVHVNAADIHGDDLKRVIDVYERVERALYDLCAPSRLTNHFSQVCGKLLKSYGNTGREIRRNIVTKMYRSGEPIDCAKSFKGERRHREMKKRGEELKDRKSQNRCDSRYRALNLASYFKRGTIEFRHFEGMIDFTDISGWAMTVGHVIDAAVRMSDRQIAVLPANSRKALMAILPEWHHPWLFDRWTRMDQLANDTYGHQQIRKEVWGL